MQKKIPYFANLQQKCLFSFCTIGHIMLQARPKSKTGFRTRLNIYSTGKMAITENNDSYCGGCRRNEPGNILSVHHHALLCGDVLV